MQTDAVCLQEAKQVRSTTRTIAYAAPFEWRSPVIPNSADHLTTAPRVAIIREEGSNGDREMAAAFAMAGFQPYDVTMTDLLAGHTLQQYRFRHRSDTLSFGVCNGCQLMAHLGWVGEYEGTPSVFLAENRCGRFESSFGPVRIEDSTSVWLRDMAGAVLGLWSSHGEGWAAAIRYNPVVSLEFSRFRHRSDTLSFGVCNGCQLMAHLGWVGEYGTRHSSVFLAENRCGRFESSFGPVRIEDSTSVWLRDMAGAVLGLWSSHGEGRFTYRSPDVLNSLRKSRQIAVRYADSEGRPTMQYPWNPNGSEDAVAAICSEDGRHLAMMPHSDRSFLSWQWPDYPRDWNSENCASPWLRMFQNAYSWIQEN
ncbi:hypothetical protein ANCDUO_04031 [Ancylostoma duodenale]|uniref:Phosphoribosylformylglycinamidine synthase n=1 Tax=Ancylostoma duodenale TaxID=51022 RepID=A0A0C2DS89_9BILA|nr:hypothetical protein ANCDUO_04031 [Ancylostoma duodenale]